MKTKVSPAVVGAFVLGAFALALVAMLSFGGVNFFHKPQRFLVFFDDRVQGLNPGSPVKLRGVPVGRVVDLHIRYDPSDKALNHSLVSALCEFDHNTIKTDRGQEVDITDRAAVQALVDHGMRAQLGVSGFATGTLYVELDFLDPKSVLDPTKRPVETALTDTRYPVVPSVPSDISAALESAIEFVTKINEIDFKGIAAELRDLLADTRKQIDGMDLKGLTDQWKRTGASADALVNSPEIKQVFLTLDATLGDLRGAIGRLDHQIGTNGEDLTATLASAQAALKEFNTTALTLHRFIAAQQGLGENANKTLAQLADAADAVERLADFLERNPNALLSGKKLPP